MEVAVSELRANLRHWVDLVRDGDEVIVTERGVPVARMVAVGSRTALEALTQDGAIARPVSQRRPTARGARRTRSRRSVSARVSEQRS